MAKTSTKDKSISCPYLDRHHRGHSSRSPDRSTRIRHRQTVRHRGHETRSIPRSLLEPWRHLSRPLPVSPTLAVCKSTKNEVLEHNKTNKNWPIIWITELVNLYIKTQCKEQNQLISSIIWFSGHPIMTSAERGYAKCRQGRLCTSWIFASKFGTYKLFL